MAKNKKQSFKDWLRMKTNGLVEHDKGDSITLFRSQLEPKQNVEKHGLISKNKLRINDWERH